MDNHVQAHSALLPSGPSRFPATSDGRTATPQENGFTTPDEETHNSDDHNRASTSSNNARITIPDEETHSSDDYNRASTSSNNARITNLPQKAGQHKRAWRYWKFEICAAVLSLSSLVALIVVLRYFHDRHQSTFKLDFFTPNSIVALLSTAIRTSMLACICALLSQWKWNLVGRQEGDRISTLEVYDQASRGPWGCLQLLIRSRPRGLRAYFGYFLALLSIVSLAFDTFSQVILTTELSPQNISISGIARSEYYDNNLHTILPVRKWDLTFRTAWYSGFVASTGDDVTLSCPTGNCMFPPTPSLGVCGRCRDLKDAIMSSNCRCVPKSDLPANDNRGCASDEDPICDFTLPNNFSVPTELASSFTKWNGTKYDNSLDGALSFMVVEYSDSEFAEYSNISVAEFLAIGFDYQHLSQTYLNSSFQIVANSCQLSMCVKEITASVVEGRQQQGINRTWHKPNVTKFNSDAYTFVDVPPEYAPRSTDHNDSFQLGTFFRMAMGQQYNLGLLGNATQRDYQGYEISTDFVEGIWHTVDYQSYIQNISISLTAAMRRTAAASEDPRYGGLAQSLVPVWKVRWPWITFPVVLVLLTIGAFLLSLLKSHSPTPVPWKGDALSLLFCRVNEELREPFVQTNGDILSVAKQLGGVHVTLRPEEDGWTIAPSPTIAEKA